MGDLEDALINTGFFPFLAAGISASEDTDESPRLRLAGNFNIVRRLSDEHWQIVRDTLVRSIDRLRSTPLDDLIRG